MERLLFVPESTLTPASCLEVEGIRTAIERLRDSFIVDVFHWPTMKGGPAAEASWRGAAASLRDAISPGSHVFLMGSAALGLMAVTGGATQLRSFISDGMRVPPATLSALGMAAVADAAASAYRDPRNFQRVSVYMEGAREEEIAALAARIDAEVDWPYSAGFIRSWMGLNLLNENPSLDVPTLYLEPAIRTPGLTDLADVFLRFVPHAEVRFLKSWPGRMQEPTPGRELASELTNWVKSVTGQPSL